MAKGLIVLILLQVDMIQAYNGDKDKLGNAEKFYLLLSQLPGYKMRVEGMLLKVFMLLSCLHLWNTILFSN